MPNPRTNWKTSNHKTFSLIENPSDDLVVFLNYEGKTKSEVLSALPRHAARSNRDANAGPDPKRYREPREVYESLGMVYEEEVSHGGPIIRLTELGRAVRRHLGQVSEKDITLLGRHLAYALSACQLRNPIGVRPYDKTMEVFPYAFLWRVMLACDHKIDSDELNRAVLNIQNKSDIDEAILRINTYRLTGNKDQMGPEVDTTARANDRLISWISHGSFGYLFITQKEDGYYRIRPRAVDILQHASSIPRRHLNFSSKRKYVQYISHAAALPPDLR